MTHPSDLPASHALTAWRAGFVRRWHSNPDLSDLSDEIAAHQWRCAMLAVKLFPNPSNALLFKCLTHDIAEVAVGDLSRRCRDQAFVAALDEAEAHALEAMGFERGALLPFDERRFAFIDRLDAYLFVLHRRPRVLLGTGWGDEHDWLVAEWRGMMRNEEWETMIGGRP